MNAALLPPIAIEGGSIKVRLCAADMVLLRVETGGAEFSLHMTKAETADLADRLVRALLAAGHGKPIVDLPNGVA